MQQKPEIIYQSETHPQLQVKRREDRTWAAWKEKGDTMGKFLAYIIETDRGFETCQYENKAHHHNAAFDTLAEAAESAAVGNGKIYAEAEGINIAGTMAELDLTKRQRRTAERFIEGVLENYSLHGRTMPEVQVFRAEMIYGGVLSISIDLGHIDDNLSALWLTREHRHVFVGKRGGIELANAKGKSGKYLRRHPHGLHHAVNHAV